MFDFDNKNIIGEVCMKTMKKITAVFLSVVMLLAAFGTGLTAFAASSEFVLTMPEKVTQGDTFDVLVSCGGSVGAKGFSCGTIIVKYDPNMLELESYTVLPDFRECRSILWYNADGTPEYGASKWKKDNMSFSSQINNGEGALSKGEFLLMLMDYSEDENGHQNRYQKTDLNLISFSFKALNAGYSDISVYLNNVDWDGESKPTTGNHNIEIKQESAIQSEPIITPINTVELSYMGDIDNDGKVTAADARTILRHSAKLEFIPDNILSRAYTDKDEKITAAYARIALRMSARLEPLVTDHEHEYVSTEIQISDCENNGVIEHTCSICGDSYREEKATAGHSYIKTKTVDATCSVDGYATYNCSVCGNSYTEKIPATNRHLYLETNYTDASCVFEGKIEYKCTYCDDIYTETIPELKHDLSSDHLCRMCNTYITNDFFIAFGDQQGNLLPAQTKCSILGQRQSETEITKVLNVLP